MNHPTMHRSIPHSIYAILILLSGVFSACGDTAQTGNSGSGEITAEELAGYIKEISSDNYMGRKPFTKGEELTVAYLTTQLKAMGLQPGNGDKYTQDVPLIEITGKPAPTMAVTGNGGNLTLDLMEDYVLLTQREQAQIDINNSELVFCGFGIVAPEYGWNDYAGLDLKGKTAVVLVNDPGFGGEDTTFFKGNTMTYYGRWTYKYEEAERQGAQGILIIHETTSAGYPWFVVQNGWSGAQLQLQSDDGNLTKPEVQGWITLDVAKELFETSGLDLGKEIRRARTKEFTPVAMGLSISTSLTNTFKEDLSQNVIAKVEGSTRPDEVIIYTAHWDHLGVGPAVEGDSIFNGAVDNGTGVACILSIAQAFAKQEEKPERSVAFLFVTAEEQGLLGSKWYAEHPIYPVNKTVANLNMDGLLSIGETKDVIVVGYGQSEMDEYAIEAAAAQDRYVVPDQEPEKGYFFRSDHFNFAKVGIPALYAESGPDHRTRGREYGVKLRSAYTANDYHKPSDEYDENWDLGGLVQDTEFFLAIGRKLASESSFPEWKEGSEFRNIRK